MNEIVENPATEKPIPTSKFTYLKRNTGLLLTFAILASFWTALVIFQDYLPTKKEPLVQEQSDSLANVLVILDTKLNDRSTPGSMTIEFNQPIDLHTFEHATTLIPAIEGEWSVDPKDPTIVRYTFDEVFKGQYISIYISEGLVSENNRTLIHDYENHFTMMRDRRNQEYSRVKSFPVGVAIPLNSFVPSVNIYKSNAQSLLSFLKYSVEDDKRGSMYDSTYTQTEITHADKDKVKNIKSNDEEDAVFLDPGVYYIENDGDKPYFVVVSSFGVALRQDDQQVMFGIFDIRNGTKISEDVTLGLYNLKDGVNLLKDFKYSENVSQSLVYPTRLDAAIAIYKDQVAFVPVELPSSLADIQVSSNLDTDAKVFVYTERPIYKPGDTVFVRGMVRQDSDSLYRVPVAGTPVYVRMNGITESQTVLLDEYGTFSTHFVLPGDTESEYSWVDAGVRPFNDDEYYGRSAASFEVKKYIKPEFELKARVEKDDHLRSDKSKFIISGNYFDGKPLGNKELTYTVYSDNYYEVEKAVYNQNFNITGAGGMCGGGGFSDYFGNEYHTGSVKLDDRGEASIEIDADKATLLSQKITLVAKAMDNNSNEIVAAAKSIVHAAEFNIFFIPSTNNYSAGEEVVIPFYAESLSGDKTRNTSFSYKLVKTSYGYSNNGTTYGVTDQNEIVSGSVSTDDNGKGIVQFRLPKDLEPDQLQFVLSAKDSKQNVAENQKYLSILSTEQKEAVQGPSWGGRISQTYLKITSSQNTFKVNDTVNLSIDSPTDVDALVTLERGRIYSPTFVHLNKGMNQLQFPITEELSPSITVVFTFFSDGNYYSEGLSLNAPAMHKLLNIDLSANKSAYTPDETAELLIKTTDADGAPVAAQMSVGVVDKAIYALRESATPPVHSSFYYFRPRRTNASSSLTGFGDWGGGGGGGGDGGGPGSNADVLYWNPNVRTDTSGEVRIPVPLLGYKTIWKVQVIGSTVNSQVGQDDTEFTVTSEVKGASTQRRLWWW